MILYKTSLLFLIPLGTVRTPDLPLTILNDPSPSQGALNPWQGVQRPWHVAKDPWAFEFNP